MNADLPPRSSGRLQHEYLKNSYTPRTKIRVKVLDFVQDGGVYVTGGAILGRVGNGYIGRLRW